MQHLCEAGNTGPQSFTTVTKVKKALKIERYFLTHLAAKTGLNGIMWVQLPFSFTTFVHLLQMFITVITEIGQWLWGNAGV